MLVSWRSITGSGCMLNLFVCCAVVWADLPGDAGSTSLLNRHLTYTRPEKPYVILRRGEVEAVVVDNSEVDDDILPGHRAGYSGIGALRHSQRRDNLFAPPIAGLNFEHIHDGTIQERDILYEPRRAPMELRVIDEHTAELYQPPTPHWGLESVQRYHLLADGTIELTFECIPRRKTFAHDYIGLFWASYIHQPESLDIHFRGHTEAHADNSDWIRGVTPEHGKLSTHVGLNDSRDFPHDPKFPLTLVFNRSGYRYAEPWYYGVSHGMAYVQMFRPGDQVWLTQSPSGGGKGNPAWDFQFFIRDYEVGRCYRLVMRAAYIPYHSPRQVEQATARHREFLAR
ncbi:MAG: hypothetical protein KDA76_01310 [Planctomycetaceae bacterium]|nr:hypothetical protein [Planctomycetaceae bacterium]